MPETIGAQWARGAVVVEYEHRCLTATDFKRADDEPSITGADRIRNAPFHRGHDLFGYAGASKCAVDPFFEVGRLLASPTT